MKRTRLKVYGEHTRDTSEPSLCLSCRYAMVVRGARASDDQVICKAGLGPIRMHVVECNTYDDAAKIAEWELEKVAWIWLTDRFVSPKEFAKLDDD